MYRLPGDSVTSHTQQPTVPETQTTPKYAGHLTGSIPYPNQEVRPTRQKMTVSGAIWSGKGIKYLMRHRRRGLYEYLKPQFPFFVMMLSMPYFLSFFIQTK